MRPIHPSGLPACPQERRIGDPDMIRGVLPMEIQPISVRVVPRESTPGAQGSFIGSSLATRRERPYLPVGFNSVSNRQSVRCRRGFAWLRLFGLIAVLSLMSSPACAATAFSVEPSQVTVNLPAPPRTMVARVTIDNAVNEVVRVQLALSFGSDDGEEAVSDQLVVPPELTLGPAAKRPVAITTSAQPSHILPGVYRGELIVKGTGADRRSVEPVVVDVEVSPPVTPAQDEVTLRATRSSPFGSVRGALEGGVPVLLPAVASSGEPLGDRDLNNGRVAGTLTHPDGEVTAVELNGIDEGSPRDSVATYRLTVDEISDVGTHSGAVDVLPEDPSAGEVDLRVIVTDPIWWAVLPLVTGMALAGGVLGPWPLRTARMAFSDPSARRRYHGYGPRGFEIMVGLAPVVVWLGLNLFYFDRAFGEVRDYVNVFLWGVAGVTAAAGLELIWLRMWRPP